MLYAIINKEENIAIAAFNSYEQAERTMKDWIAADMANGDFKPHGYEIVELKNRREFVKKCS